MKRFEHSLVLITGAGSGIGEATAKRVAQEGADVILVGRTLSKLERVAEEIKKRTNQNAYPFACDVTDEEDVQKLQDYVKAEFSDLTVLINNAGGSAYSSLLDMPLGQWQAMIELNLNSVMLVTKALGKIMINAAKQEGNEKRDRAIVNVSSLSAHKPGVLFPHYSAAKAAVINLTKSFAFELAKYKIRVNSVSPGFVDTPLTEQGLKNESFLKSIERHTALKRVAKPEEIAGVIAFVASTDASYMTGSDVLVDGGWLIK